MRALIIPADLAQPCRIEELTDILVQLRHLVGGYIERTRYDFDAAMIVDEDGIASGKLLNQRATDYILARSEAADAHRMLRHEWPEGYGLYGDVVVLGADPRRMQDVWQDVPERLVRIFMEGA